MSYDERKLTRDFLRGVVTNNEDDALLTENVDLSEDIRDISASLPAQDIETQDIAQGDQTEAEAEKGVSWYNTLLELAGLIPGYGETVDAIYALVYLRKSKY